MSAPPLYRLPSYRESSWLIPFDWFLNSIFGNDAFISYKYGEGEQYVSALIQRLLEKGLLPTVLKQAAYESESEVEGAIRYALKRCRVVVVVASENALKSPG